MISRRCTFILLCLTILLVSIAVLCFLFLKSQQSDDHEESVYAAKYKHAAVSTDAKQCAKVGSDILKDKNGTAVDAAIAAMICMGLVTPESMGLGGGSFMIVFNRTTGKVTALSGRETAPHYATEGMFDGDANKSQVGVEAIAVPGDVALYFKAHQMFGRVNFSALVQPTIDLAREGFEVGLHFDNAIKVREGRFIQFNVTKLMHLLTNNKTGDYYRLGEMMKREDLANTLEIIQREGRDSLYSENGTIAKMLLKDLQDQGSRMTMADLTGFQVQVEERISRVLPNGMNFYSTPLPGSGPVLGFILDTVMRTFNVSVKLKENDIDFFNRYLAEAFKFAYGQRGLLGDPEFEKTLNSSSWDKTDAALTRLESEQYAKFIAETIMHMNRTENRPEFYQQQDHYEGYRPDQGTAGLTVVDAEGNVVAVGGTVNAYFGSYVVSESTGIILNNEMDDFSANVVNLYGVHPSDHNRIAPGKRPFSSIAPCIITSGSGANQTFVLSMGASGGTQITTSEALVALRTILFDGVSLEKAVGEPRIHHQLNPNELKFENEPDATVPEERRQALRKFGHNVTAIVGRGSIVMAIKRSAEGELEAVTDWRKGGAVDGF